MKPSCSYVGLALELAALACRAAPGETGVDWTARWRGGDAFNAMPTAVAASSTIVVAVGPAALLTSPDGLAWRATWWDEARIVGGADPFPWLFDVQDIAWGRALFVAVGSAKTDQQAERRPLIVTSPDGVTWTARSAPAGVSYLSSVAWCSDRFVAVGGMSILTSTDGVTWTAQTLPGGGYLSAVTRGDSLFVAVGTHGWPARGPLIVTSPDGATWIPRTVPDTVLAWGLRDVTWSGDLFVAVGFSHVLTSREGVAWTPRAALGGGLKSVTWGASQFVAVGYDILSSPDGIAWTPRRTRGDFYTGDVAWTGSRFVALGFTRHGWFADYQRGLIASSP